jgi:hypothetical protein
MPYYSKTTNGFYSEAVHGPKTKLIPNPAWERPEVNGVPDGAAEAPLMEVRSPDCKIPPDAVAITDEQWRALLDAQSTGKSIRADDTGFPVAG